MYTYVADTTPNPRLPAPPPPSRPPTTTRPGGVEHQQRRAAVVAVMFAIGCAVVEGGDDKSIEFAGETGGDPAA